MTMGGDHSTTATILKAQSERHGPISLIQIDAQWVHENGIDATVERIKEVVGGQPAYLTFNIDTLDPALAPETGTPVCGGLSTWQAQSLVRKLVGVNLIGADLVEVSPPYDHAEITALAAASLLLDMVCMFKANQKT